MPSYKRSSVQFPPGLEKAIRTRAAQQGLPLATYTTLLIERGWFAEEQGRVAELLDSLTAVLERVPNSPPTTAVGASLPAPVLNTLAQIFARVQLTAAASGIDAGKAEALTASYLNQLTSALKG